jgi:hypothetical protein
VTVSGGLDPNVVAAATAAKRARGYNVRFQSTSLTLTVVPNGACTISPTMRFEYVSYYLRGNLAERWVNDYQLSAGRADPGGSGCSGALRAIHVFTGGDGIPLKPQSVQDTWSASRGSDGTWTLKLPNGRGGSVNDMPYLLR